MCRNKTIKKQGHIPACEEIKSINSAFKANYMGIEITITHSCANGYQYKLDKIYKFPDGKNQNWIDINDKNLILNK